MSSPTSARAVVERALTASRLDRLSGIYACIALVVVFGSVTPDLFLSQVTFRTVLAQNAITALVSIGLLIPLACGVFDLSIGAVLGFSVVLVAWLQSQHHVNALFASVVTVLVGSLIGLVNACLIVFANVNSFIATLGMSSVLSAATVWITGNQEIVGGISSTFQRFGSDIIWGIPVVAYYMIGLAIIVWFMMEYTPIGRRCYAVGGNADAARLSGVPVARYIFGSLLVSATIAAGAGVVFAAQIGSASLNAGPPFLLPAFASVFLGATQIHPGRVNVPGTIVAVALLAIGIKGLQLVGAPNYISDLFNGLALILAVGLASLRRGEERYAINA